MRKLERRHFLKAAGAAGVAYAFGRNPGAVQAQALLGPAATTDYRALVCVFLFGGNDSFNMVVPRAGAAYATYAAARQNLAIDSQDLLPITPLTPQLDGTELGLHPALAQIAALFENDRACAIVANLGPLLEPTTRDQFLAQSVALPPQLFSHNDQQDQWHALHGRRTATSGWAGRVADMLAGSTTAQGVPLNISLSGQTLYQSGATSIPYTMGPEGPVEFFGLAATDGLSIARRDAFLSVLRVNHPTIYEQALADVQERALDAASRITRELEKVRAPNTPAFTTAFPASPLGTQLRTVAEMIAVRESFTASRQVFFVSAGGFDTHDAQAEDQPGLLANLGDSLAAFYRATVEMGVASSVTAFTQSDFGRTLTSNGDGTDHGWGGNQLVVGGAVAGRDVYGRYPRLELGGPDDAGAGRIIPTTSCDQYAATLARWFGVSDGQLDAIAPNLAKFASRDLRFLI